VAAEEWASSVCGALTDWQGSITASPPDVSDPTDLEATKQELTGFLDGVISSTESLVSEVEAAGVPDVEQGDAIASDFQSALESVRDSFSQARSEVESLSTDDPGGFSTSLSEIGTALTQAGTEASTAISELGTTYPDSGIDEAFASAPECSGLAGSSS
jgi:hypothetical protein